MLRSPIATAPRVAAMTLLIWRTSPRPAVSQLGNGGPAPYLLDRHRPVTQLSRGHRHERRQPPRLEVHADGPGPEWVAELQRTGGHGDHAAVGVLGRLDVSDGANAERRPEVDDEQRRRHRR